LYFITYFQLLVQNTRFSDKTDSWWRRGVAVTSLGVSTRLLYIGPG